MRKTIFLAACFSLFGMIGSAQDFNLRPVKYTEIKGAPTFSQPKFITDKKGEKLFVEKFGHAAPLLFDWDGDGKNDLLVGEFGGGKNANVMVFKNIGTNKKPIFASEGFYAKDKNGDNLFISGS